MKFADALYLLVTDQVCNWQSRTWGVLAAEGRVLRSRMNCTSLSLAASQMDLVCCAEKGHACPPKNEPSLGCFQGYLREPGVVWERLSGIDGDAQFYQVQRLTWPHFMGCTSCMWQYI